MGSVNKVILVGNLGRDAELRYTPAGAAVATLNLATTETWNDKEGQRQEKTEWHRVILWGKQAETLNQYLQKGKQIYVEGRLQTRQWDDKDGNKRYTTEIRGDRVVLLSGGGGGGGSARRAAAAARCRTRADGRRRRSCPRTTFRSERTLDVTSTRHSVQAHLYGSCVFVSLPCRTCLRSLHHVIELRRRHLDDVAVLDRGHAVHGAGRDVEPLEGRHARTSRARRSRGFRTAASPSTTGSSRPSCCGTAG